MAATSESSLFWFVMSYFVAQVGNCLLVYKITKQRSVFGISLDSQVALLLATLARCVWFSDTRLPTMWLAIAELTIAVCLHCYIVYQCVNLKDTL